MGRPSLLTPERIETITYLIREGNSQDTAAAASGISKSVFYKWMARGRKEKDRIEAAKRGKPRASEAIYVQLVEDVEKARGVAEAKLVALIAAAAQEPKTWQAAAWLLERRDPQKWGRVWRSNENETKDKGALEKNIRRVTEGDPLPGE